MAQASKTFDGVEVREIPGYSGYFASADGRILGRSGRWLKLYVESRGYASFVPGHGAGRMRVHRAVALAWLVKPSDPTLVVCHNKSESRPLDNSASNLRWDTQASNMEDKAIDGTHQNAKKTHCKNGHEFTESNTRYRPNTSGSITAAWRQCRACSIESSRDYRRQEQ